MNPENNSQEQEENLKEMNYSPENDIFNQEKAIPLDGDGNPLTGDRQTQKRLLDLIFQVMKMTIILSK